MTILPPYLEPGDAIGVVCPAGYMPKKDFKTAIKTLEKWGFKVVLGKTPGNKSDYFSGTDAVRRRDLQRMLDNSRLKAILSARGGYGTGRIIDSLNFDKFVKNPKWVIGFSDITILLSHIYSNYKIATLHAPMAAAFNKGEADNKYVRSLRDALMGKKGHYRVRGKKENQPGTGNGILVGGNLTLLTNIIGTPSDIPTRGKILFIEDTGEYIYNIDRMMSQLKRSGKLDRLQGLVVGRFNDIKDSKPSFGQTALDVIKAHVKDYNYPVCFDFPVSHKKQNVALKVGVKYRLEVSKDKAELEEL